MRTSNIKLVVIFTLFIGLNSLLAQNKKTIQLYKIQKSKAVNRTLKTIDSKNIKYLNISENKKEGLVWLDTKEFKNGSIEIKMRGKDELQKSFIGIAFHAKNDSVYDAIYCRPFNFLAKDSVRRIHVIQYISHPKFTWKKLRDEKNAQFEKEISNPPDPNDWFIMRLYVKDNKIEAFINDSNKPSLIVNKLSNNNEGKIGLFVADSSGGDFESIKIYFEK